jgi:hypothetical protein
MFGMDFADGQVAAFKARKSKNKIIPDLGKCQIFSLANLNTSTETL